jgi:MtN3 and saliva related transmembrane protein
MNQWMITSVEFLFALALFANALLFIPQAWRIFRQKESKEVSLITFGGFWIGQLLTVFHAIIKHDLILLSGYLLALVTCGAVIVLTIKYR